MRQIILYIVFLVFAGFSMATAQPHTNDTQATLTRTGGLEITIYAKPITTVNIGTGVSFLFSVSLPGTSGNPASLTAMTLIGGTIAAGAIEIIGGRTHYPYAVESLSSTVALTGDASTAIAKVTFPTTEDGDVVQMNDYTASGTTNVYWYISYSGFDNTNDLEKFYGALAVNGPDSQVEAELPLPVTLISFDAEKLNDRHSLLSWSTASEINSSFFSIQRSLDKKVWTSVGKVNAQGNSQIIHNYEFVDENVYNGLDARLSVYYRLETVDLDGQRRMSPVKDVVFGNSSFANREVAVYPNPSSEGVQLEWDASRVDQPTSIEFFSSKGELVYTSKVPENTNQQYINFDQTSILPGLYILRILSGTEAIEHKQIIVTQR